MFFPSTKVAFLLDYEYQPIYSSATLAYISIYIYVYIYPPWLLQPRFLRSFLESLRPHPRCPHRRFNPPFLLPLLLLFAYLRLSLHFSAPLHPCLPPFYLFPLSARLAPSLQPILSLFLPPIRLPYKLPHSLPPNFYFRFIFYA